MLGSEGDWAVMKACVETLRKFGVACEARVLSAHRTPGETAEFARGAAERGLEVIIAAAGMAAHLAGAVAAQTTLPVIGVPLSSGALQGVDALLSTVQMPAGVPVATVGLGEAGARNAAVLAVQMLALADERLGKRLAEHKRQLAEAVRQQDAALQGEAGRGV